MIVTAVAAVAALLWLGYAFTRRVDDFPLLHQRERAMATMQGWHYGPQRRPTRNAVHILDDDRR